MGEHGNQGHALRERTGTTHRMREDLLPAPLLRSAPSTPI